MQDLEFKHQGTLLFKVGPSFGPLTNTCIYKNCIYLFTRNDIPNKIDIPNTPSMEYVPTFTPKIDPRWYIFHIWSRINLRCAVPIPGRSLGGTCRARLRRRLGAEPGGDGAGGGQGRWPRDGVGLRDLATDAERDGLLGERYQEALRMRWYG